MSVMWETGKGELVAGKLMGLDRTDLWFTFEALPGYGHYLLLAGCEGAGGFVLVFGFVRHLRLSVSYASS